MIVAVAGTDTSQSPPTNPTALHTLQTLELLNPIINYQLSIDMRADGKLPGHEQIAPSPNRILPSDHGRSAFQRPGVPAYCRKTANCQAKIYCYCQTLKHLL